jgi:hypothetical protein
MGLALGLYVLPESAPVWRSGRAEKGKACDPTKKFKWCRLWGSLLLDFGSLRQHSLGQLFYQWNN